MPNILFPGRPDYSGPTSGFFGLLHHDTLYEASHDVLERVEYVGKSKPLREVNIRLHNMIYLGDCEAVEKHESIRLKNKTECAPFYAEHSALTTALYTTYRAKINDLNDKREARLASLHRGKKSVAKRLALRASYDSDYNNKCAELYSEYEAKRLAFWREYSANVAPLNADYMAEYKSLDEEIFTYITLHIPDCAWNGEELVF